ncbi:MAG: hypothetical protein MJ106_00955 [Lentisphaeria bacterium]|nr:hypothetical protein [Lentisphaeria bacterium]
MTPADALAELLERLRDLEKLNPDLSGVEQYRLDALAQHCESASFGVVAEQVRKLIDIYLDAPTIRVGKAILKEYFGALERTAKNLLEAGEINAVHSRESDASFSKALVLYSTFDYDALDRCKILNRAEIPETLSNAADAYRRRLEVVDTVFGIGFRVLWNLDQTLFQDWSLKYLDETSGNLSPEVIRDMIWVLRNSKEIQPGVLEWLLRWCGDEALLEHWPLVVRYADRLLDRLALEKWRLSNAKPRNGSVAYLRLLTQRGNIEESRLMAWLVNTLQNFGGSIERFISLDREISASEEAWVHSALVAELRNLESIYQPVIVLSDHLLAEPDGAAKLAMAFLGVVGQGLKDWEERMREFSERVIRRAFLVDLKEGRTPVETIRRYTFGDEKAFAIICNELDLVSQQFDSLKQREIVVRKLSVFYSSYRRAPLLGQEVARRYRHFARILHEDFLSTHLTQEEFAAFEKSGFIHELYSMGSRAKRFLDHRRALEMTVEEMVASQMEFIAETRARRLTMLRRLMPSGR